MRFLFKQNDEVASGLNQSSAPESLRDSAPKSEIGRVQEDMVIDQTRLDEEVLDESVLRALVLSDDPLEEKLPGWKDSFIKDLQAAREKAQELKAVRSIEAEVRTYAKWVDEYGLDFLVSLIPGVGDGVSSVGSGVFLWIEAARSGQKNPWAYIKIAGLEAADFFMGAIPVVGDVADYFFKANKWLAKDFTKQREALEQEVRLAVENVGLSEASALAILKEMEAPGEKLEQLGAVVGNRLKKATHSLRPKKS